MNRELSTDMIPTMGQRDDQRIVRIGLGVAVLSFLLNPLIQLGQALGYKLSGGEVLVLFIVTGAGFLVGVGLILSGVEMLRRLRSPITLRSPLRGRSTPQDSATQVVASGPQLGGRPYWGDEVNKLHVQIIHLENELREWGLDAAARKLLKQALDHFPSLSVFFVKDFAGLLHAAHVKPRTTFPVEFEAVDAARARGKVGLPAINRTLELPYPEAKMYADQFRKMIEDVQNESINEGKRQQP